jgi:hypothetical protein
VQASAGSVTTSTACRGAAVERCLASRCRRSTSVNMITSGPYSSGCCTRPDDLCGTRESPSLWAARVNRHGWNARLRASRTVSENHAAAHRSKAAVVPSSAGLRVVSASAASSPPAAASTSSDPLPTKYCSIPTSTNSYILCNSGCDLFLNVIQRVGKVVHIYGHGGALG